MDTKFYVYAYLDPRKPGSYSFDGIGTTFEFEPFYIGKGKGCRCIEHLKDCSGTYKSNKIQKILKLGLKPIIRKVFNCLNEQLAFQLEIELIKHIGRSDLRTGSLTNLTDGGEGQSGLVHSKETKKRISQTLKKKYETGEISPTNLGKPIPEDVKQKIREKLSGKNGPFYGRHHTKESIDCMISKFGDRSGKNNSMYGRKHTEETKRKISESRKGKCKGKDNPAYGHAYQTFFKHTKETRKKLSESRKLYLAKLRSEKLNRELKFLNWQNFCQNI